MAGAAPSTAFSRVLRPDLLASLGDLELAARLIVEGMQAGGHRSLYRGVGTEFVQHRPYVQGDSLRYLDWKLLARTDRLQTRQYRESTQVGLLLVLDTSASMGFPEPAGSAPAPAWAREGEGEGGTGFVVSRLRYGILLAAALAWLAISRGEAVGLLTWTGSRPLHLPPRSGRPHLRRLLAELERLEPRGAWPPAEAMDQAAALLRRRGMVVAISDFYDDEAALQSSLRRAARRGHDVAMLQLTSEEEVDFPFDGEMEFEDAETGARLLTHAGSSADAVRARIRAFHDRLRRAALRDGIDHLRLSTSEAPGPALRRYLLTRAR
jgi:uncharacterized protein (DUF58 family)